MKPWTGREIAQLRQMRIRKLSRAAIAAETGRSVAAVKAQLGRMKITLPVKRRQQPEAAPSPRILIGVRGHFSAAHRDQRTGEIHGHTWHVLAKFETPTRVDSVCYRAALRTLLAVWDHTLLPDHLAWGEDIAAAVGILANCVEVEVSRPEEGFYVWWYA